MITEELLLEYRNLQEAMKESKEREMSIRKEIALELLEGKDVGTHSFVFGNLNVKVTRGVSYSLDEDLMVELQSKMSPAELHAIVLKPQLSLTNYKTIPVDDRKYLDMCITVKEAAPTIKVMMDGEK